METKRLSPQETQLRPGYWPDPKFINFRIPITNVARELDLEVFGMSGRCWRAFQHQNGDRTPSLSFTKRNRAKCHVCDDHAMSVIDLVIAVRDCDFRSAIEWVVARFDVPLVEKGRHVNGRAIIRPRPRALGLPLQTIVGTGYWASLSKSAKSLVIVFFGFSEREEDPQWMKISFRALCRYAGLSNASVTAGLKELSKSGLLEIDRKSQKPPLRDCNRYRLNFENPMFLEKLADLHEKNREEIEVEKALQKQRRQIRSKGIYTLGNSLSSSKSTEQSHAAMAVARDCVSTQISANAVSRGEFQ